MTNNQILQKAIDHYGAERQIDKCIEEMAELTQVLLKYKYVAESMGSDNLLAQEVKYEIADVKITVAQMEMLFGSCLEEEKFKITRLRERIGV